MQCDAAPGVKVGGNAGSCRGHHCNVGSSSIPNAWKRSGFGPDRGTAGAEDSCNDGRSKTTQGQAGAYARSCKLKSMSRKDRRSRWLEGHGRKGAPRRRGLGSRMRRDASRRCVQALLRGGERVVQAVQLGAEWAKQGEQLAVEMRELREQVAEGKRRQQRLEQRNEELTAEVAGLQSAVTVLQEIMNDDGSEGTDNGVETENSKISNEDDSESEDCEEIQETEKTPEPNVFRRMLQMVIVIDQNNTLQRGRWQTILEKVTERESKEMLRLVQALRERGKPSLHRVDRPQG